MRRVLSLVTAIVLLQSAAAANDLHVSVRGRVQADISFLAADRQEGRGVTTEGIRRAADWIVAEYERIGLKSVMPDGSWRQAFGITTGRVRVAEQTSVKFWHKDGSSLHLFVGQDFQPLRRGGSGDTSSPLVFVGYGVTAPEIGFDEYASVDVRGRTVVMIRRVPQQGHSDGVFSGEGMREHAWINTKLELARSHGAAAVVFVNDPFTARNSELDELTPPSGFGTNEVGIPFVHVRQSVINRLLAGHPLITPEGNELHNLGAVTDYIDVFFSPLSQELGSWTAHIDTRFDSGRTETWNLIGMVEGESPHAGETIVIGAHYDHIGYGDVASRARHRRGEIHNGADDNASGTAAVLELARRVVTGSPPRRRMLFVCFSGEERGLLGSWHYVRNPPVPLEDTVSMLNFDMIGSLRNNRVEVHGVATGAEFLPIVQLADEACTVDVRVVSHAFGGSDHLPFYRKGIPVLFAFTGVTDRYHTPDDDVGMIDMDGVVSVIDLGEFLLEQIDRMPERPAFRRASRNHTRMGVLGIRPDLSAFGDAHGVRVLGVREGSAAGEASVQVGDVIVKIDDEIIDSYASLNDFLRRSRGRQTVKLTVHRGNRVIELQAELGTVTR